MGWFKKSKNNFNIQFKKDLSIILNAIDRRKSLLLSDNFVDNDVAQIETEKFVIPLYENGALKTLGYCSFENKDEYYNTNEEGKVLVKDIILRIINDNDLKKLEDDIFFLHTYLSLLINNLKI
jgi:hypothetical protein